MARALELAAQGLGQTSPNPMVGAVIVRDGETIGEGAHMRLGGPHAEVAAMVDCEGGCEGATMYVALEPCCTQGRTPPCADALIKAGVKKVVCAVEDPNPKHQGKGLEILRKAGIEVQVGLLEKEARQLNEVFFTYHTEKRPFYVAKWAMTLDGRTSTDSGSSMWITNEESREYAHVLRSHCDAIMVGVGTIIQDNPRLTVRLKGYTGSQPTKVIVDGSLRSPLGARCFGRKYPRPAIFAATEISSPARIKRAEDAGHRVLIVHGNRRMVDLREMSRMLYEEGVTSVLVEGGRQIHTSLLRENLIDRVVVYVAPKFVGGRTGTMPLEDLGIAAMENALELERIRIQHFGHDVCIEGHINRDESRTESD